MVLKIDFRNLVINKVNWWCIVPVVLSILGSYTIRSIFYHHTVNYHNLKISTFFRITGVYNFLSSIVPSGIGHLSYPYLLKKYYNVMIHKGLSSLLLYNIIRVLLLVLIFTFATIFLSDLKIPAIKLNYQILVILSVFAILGIVLFLIFTNKIIFFDKTKKFLKTIGDDVCKNINFYNLLRLFGYSILIVGFNITTIYFLYKFLYVSIPIVAIGFLFSITNLSAFIPLHGPGHFGSYEAINAISLTFLQFSLNEAIQISFIIHFLALTIQGIIAVFCYFTLK